MEELPFKEKFFKVKRFSSSTIINTVAFIIRNATETRWPPHWIHYVFNAYNFAKTYS